MNYNFDNLTLLIRCLEDAKNSLELLKIAAQNTSDELQALSLAKSAAASEKDPSERNLLEQVDVAMHRSRLGKSVEEFDRAVSLSRTRLSKVQSLMPGKRLGL